MKRNVYYLLVITFVFLFLFGCKEGKVTTPIYVSDLKEIKDNFKFDTDTTIKFPVQSESWFKDNKGKISNLLNRYFNNYDESSLRIVETGMNTMAEVKVSVPIFNYKKIKEGNKKPNYSLINYGVEQGVKDYEHSPFNNLVVIIFNDYKDFVNDFDSTFMMADFDISNFKIIMDIRNDEREKFTYRIGSCYINGDALPFKRKIELDGRDEHTITFSEVYTYVFPYYADKEVNEVVMSFK